MSRGCERCAIIAVAIRSMFTKYVRPSVFPNDGCECDFCYVVTKLNSNGIRTDREWLSHPDIETLFNGIDPNRLPTGDVWCRGAVDEYLATICAREPKPTPVDWADNHMFVNRYHSKRAVLPYFVQRFECGECQECTGAGPHGKDLIACGDVEENPGPPCDETTVQPQLTPAGDVRETCTYALLVVLFKCVCYTAAFVWRNRALFWKLPYIVVWVLSLYAVRYLSTRDAAAVAARINLIQVEALSAKAQAAQEYSKLSALYNTRGQRINEMAEALADLNATCRRTVQEREQNTVLVVESYENIIRLKDANITALTGLYEQQIAAERAQLEQNTTAVVETYENLVRLKEANITALAELYEQQLAVERAQSEQNATAIMETYENIIRLMEANLTAMSELYERQLNMERAHSERKLTLANVRFERLGNTSEANILALELEVGAMHVAYNNLLDSHKTLNATFVRQSRRVESAWVVANTLAVLLVTATSIVVCRIVAATLYRRSVSAFAYTRRKMYERQITGFDTEIATYMYTLYGNTLCIEHVKSASCGLDRASIKHEAENQMCLRCYRLAQLESGVEDAPLPPIRIYCNHECPILKTDKFTPPLLAVRYYHALIEWATRPGGSTPEARGHMQTRGQKYGAFVFGQIEQYDPDEEVDVQRITVQESGSDRTQNRGDMPPTEYEPPSSSHIDFDTATHAAAAVHGTAAPRTPYSDSVRVFAFVRSYLTSKTVTDRLETLGKGDYTPVEHIGPQPRDVDCAKFADWVANSVKAKLVRNRYPRLHPIVADAINQWAFDTALAQAYTVTAHAAHDPPRRLPSHPNLHELNAKAAEVMAAKKAAKLKPLINEVASASDADKAAMDLLYEQARLMVDTDTVPQEVLDRHFATVISSGKSKSWADQMDEQEMLIHMVAQFLSENIKDEKRVEAFVRGMFTHKDPPRFAHVANKFVQFTDDVPADIEAEVAANKAATLERLDKEAPTVSPEAGLTMQQVEQMLQQVVDTVVERVTPEAPTVPPEPSPTMQQVEQMIQQAVETAVKRVKPKNSGGNSQVVPNTQSSRQSSNVKKAQQQQTPKPEASVPGSAPSPLLGMVAAIGDTDGNYISQGYLRRFCTGVIFGTCRHAYSKEEKPQLVDGLLEVGTQLTVRTVRATLTATIAHRHHEHGDEVWYALDFLGASPTVPKYEIYSEADLRKLSDGSAVTAMPFICPNGRIADGEFKTLGGVINKIANPMAITYHMSTDYGYCRMAVVSANGKLLCGHWDGDSKAVSPNRPGGSVCVLPPDRVSYWTVGAFDRKFYGLAKCQATGLQHLACCEKRFTGHTEHKKVWPLRRDMQDFHGLATRHVLMRPSTEMNLNEIQQFGAPIQDVDHDWSRAAEILTVIEEGLSTPYVGASSERLRMCIEAVGRQPKMAGPGRPMHEQYLTELGGGCYATGVERMHSQLWSFLAALEDGQPTPEAQSLWEELRYWSVFGKLDRYKPSKLDIGRTIQAPPLELKVMHLYFFGDSDMHWVSRMATGVPAWVYAGHDFDMPVSEKRIQKYASAKACLALDMTAFDRRMTRAMVSAHFEHLSMLYPGIPDFVFEFFYDIVCNTKLVLSNGMVYQKARGNPSGYPNTLRLNCSVNMMAWLLCIEDLMGWHNVRPDQFVANLRRHFHIEICGDDSRVWALTDSAVAALRVAQQWWANNLPWDAKLEGYAAFDPRDGFMNLLNAPPMVSRRFAFFRFGGADYLFEPLMDVSRCLSRWLHCVERTPDKQKEVEMGVSLTVALLWYQTVVLSNIESPTIRAYEALCTDDMRITMLQRVAQVWREGIPMVPALVL